MLKLTQNPKFLIIAYLGIWPFSSYGQTTHTAVPISESVAHEFDGPHENKESFTDQIKKIFGITYFTYAFGPGFHPDSREFYPNQLGKPDDDGIYFQNQFSVRYKFSNNIAIDFQNRFKTIFNNYKENENFTPLRWETPRIGISGKFISKNGWDLTGSINTDFPYFFPSPFSGYQSKQRQTLFTPGMFAGLKYQPEKSKWSFFSVLSPRYFFYSDRNSAESQYKNAGYMPRNKPELILSLQPTINYSIASSTKITIGTLIDYRKHIISSWNILNASLLSNGESPSWRLSPIPINFGITHTFNQALTIFPFIVTYPIAIQRKNAETREQASILKATAFGMWISGTLF